MCEQLGVLFFDDMVKQVVLQTNKACLNQVPQEVQASDQLALVVTVEAGFFESFLALVQRFPLDVNQPHTLPQLQHKCQYLHILDQMKIAEVRLKYIGQY